MSLSITSSQVKAIAGSGARADMVAAVVAGWPNAVDKARLTTRNRAAHFLAQIMTETGGLRILEESGAYSASRISQIFGVGHHSAAITPEEARRIAALPVAHRGPVLFNRVYGTGNPRKAREFNNTGANDGWLYRGGGMMQCTGKSNYSIMAKKTGLPLVEHPELLHSPGSAFTAAYLEWAQDGRCNAAADRDDVAAVRRIINGGSNGLAECRGFLAKAKKALADYGCAAPAALVADPADDAAPPIAADPVSEVAPAVLVDPEVVGEPELFSVQKRLRAMNYSPGVIDGRWGGGTSGALSGFINDRGGHIPVPAALDAFNAARDEIKAELQRAESETPPFTRPVSEARKSGDLATVAAVEPAVLPARRSFLAWLYASITAALTAVWNTISAWASEAWDFFFDHKDDLPSDPSWLSTAWEWLGKVPVGVWLTLAAVGLALLAWDARRGMKKITEQVQTGARL